MTSKEGGQQEVERKLGDADLIVLYRTIRDHLTKNEWTAKEAAEYLDSSVYPSLFQLPRSADFIKGAHYLKAALKQINTLVVEEARLKTLSADTSNPNSATPLDVPSKQIEAENLDYQLAVIFAGEQTESASLLVGFWQSYFGKPAPPSGPVLANQFDVQGMTSPSTVSNSQWHYGTDTPVFIEDQPLFRGNIGAGVLGNFLAYGLKLLLTDYDKKDFGDTHSLVLLQDALNVENLLANLLPEAERNTFTTIATLNSIFAAASNLRPANGDQLYGGGQGKAAGDVLENVLNALGDMLGLFNKAGNGDPSSLKHLNGNPDGNTWAAMDDANGFTGRASFYGLVQAIINSGGAAGPSDIGYSGLLNKTTLSAPPSNAFGARNSFGGFLSLFYLSPFALSGNIDAALGAVQPGLYAHWLADKELTSEQRARGDAYFTDDYLNARAQFDQRLVYYNNAKARYDVTEQSHSSYPGPYESTFDFDKIIYVDTATGKKIRRQAASSDDRYVIFGTDSADSMIDGGSKSDSLFGGGGDDGLYGNEGADYLEGGEGSDVLFGGTGDDKLLGGQGTDLYFFEGDFGHDTIIDSDKNGSILFGYETLTGGKKTGDGRWESDLAGKHFTSAQREWQ